MSSLWDCSLIDVLLLIYVVLCCIMLYYVVLCCIVVSVSVVGVIVSIVCMCRLIICLFVCVVCIICLFVCGRQHLMLLSLSTIVEGLYLIVVEILAPYSASSDEQRAVLKPPDQPYRVHRYYERSD